MARADEAAEESLRNALEHVEDKDAEYWIRTALQQLVSGQK